MIYSLAPQYVMYGSQKYLAQVRTMFFDENMFADWYYRNWTQGQISVVDGGGVESVDLPHQSSVM